MVKVGLIGNLGSIIRQTGQLKNVREVQVIGKSSVGMMEEVQGKQLSIPEYNRKELIEAADFLVVENSRLLLPDLLKLAIRENKHLYITDYPEIQPEACAELLKLAEEARTMVFIADQVLSDSYQIWVKENWKEPAYINIFESLPALPEKRTYLIRYIFFAVSLFRANPQKIRVSSVHQPGSDFHFINIRLDFPSFSTFNLEMLIQPQGSQNIRMILPGKHITGDFHTHKAIVDQKETNLPSPRQQAIAELLTRSAAEDFYTASNLSIYHATLLTLRETERKIELFTPWK